MIPADFPEKTVDLQRPAGMSEEECQPLPVFRDGERCISCWRGTWLDRLRFLLTGRAWLQVWSGSSQPPVYVGTERPFVQPETEGWVDRWFEGLW